MLSFEVLQAEHGDCFLLRWREATGDRIAVIDGGLGALTAPDAVYKNLRRRLLEIRGATAQLNLDWVMVSHIDRDHIDGLLAMVSELRNAADLQRPAPFRISNFWFNSFEALAGFGGGAAAATAALASLASGAGNDPGFSGESQAVLAGVPEGVSLRAGLESLPGVQINAPVGGLLIAKATPVPLGDLSVTIVGPLPDQLAALKTAWEAHVNGRTAETASYADKSIPNLSSLVCHVAYGAGPQRRTLLLTGDARGDYILQGLRETGLLTGDTLALDLLKVQHHGSDRDVVQDYFRQLPARHYVISANGKDDNPDRDTLTWLIKARGNDQYKLHISNRQEWMPAFFDSLRPGRNFEVLYRGELGDKTSVDEIDLMAPL